jgi:hypothetical protein
VAVIGRRGASGRRDQNGANDERCDDEPLHDVSPYL